MEVDVKESETMKVKLKDIGQTTIEGQKLLFELRSNHLSGHRW